MSSSSSDKLSVKRSFPDYSLIIAIGAGVYFSNRGNQPFEGANIA